MLKTTPELIYEESFILFDIGANLGQDSIARTRDNKNILCFAFEPVPGCRKIISSRLTAEYIIRGVQVKHIDPHEIRCDDCGARVALHDDLENRYNLYPYAVSDYNGCSDFYISKMATDHAAGGCSSLLKFSDNLNQTDGWVGRNDLFVESCITAEVITIKRFIEEICSHEIKKIDYFHCDTQGSDLKVLKGMEEHVHKIVEGKVEAAVCEERQLYENQHTISQTLDFLNENHFVVYKIEIHSNANEADIYFRRK